MTVRLNRHGETADGRYVVQLNDGYITECEGPHPQRLPRREWFTDWSVPGGRTAKGTQCPGSQEHYYSRWVVWDNEINDYPAWSEGPGGYDTKREAVADLEQHLAKETS